MDYFYLGVAALGVLLLAHAYADQRQVSLHRFGIESNRYFQETARVDMMSEINSTKRVRARIPTKQEENIAPTT